MSNETDTVATLVSDELGPWCYMPLDAPRNLGPVFERYNFQKLQDLQLSSVTDGGPKVLIVSSDECIYQHSVLNVDYDSLQNPKPGSKLSLHWFTKPPSNEDVVGHILLNTFDPSARIKVLQHAAYEENATVKEVLARNAPVWRYMMDWYTESKSGELPIDLIIKANG